MQNIRAELYQRFYCLDVDNAVHCQHCDDMLAKMIRWLYYTCKQESQ